jgi:hypothetical protein
MFILVFLEYQNMYVCFRCGNCQQSDLKRNRDAGAYNEYKFAGLTGPTENAVSNFLIMQKFSN